MRNVLTIMLLAPLIGGCGLVHLPTSQDYPGPVKMVCVRDSEYGQLIEDAEVEFKVGRYENWFRMPAQLSLADSRGLYSPGTSGTVDALQATSPRPGTFVFEAKTFSGSKMIWFPLPPVLGNELYKEHRAFLRASALGYSPVVFHYCPEVLPTIEAEYSAGESGLGHAKFRQDGTLDIYLVRRGKDSEATTCPR